MKGRLQFLLSVVYPLPRGLIFYLFDNNPRARRLAIGYGDILIQFRLGAPL